MKPSMRIKVYSGAGVLLFALSAALATQVAFYGGLSAGALGKLKSGVSKIWEQTQNTGDTWIKSFSRTGSQSARNRLVIEHIGEGASTLSADASQQFAMNGAFTFGKTPGLSAMDVMNNFGEKNGGETSAGGDNSNAGGGNASGGISSGQSAGAGGGGGFVPPTGDARPSYIRSAGAALKLSTHNVPDASRTIILIAAALLAQMLVKRPLGPGRG